MKRVKPFYLSAKWLRVRSKVLRRDNYLCQEAKRFGKYEEAEMVHHIYPLEEYPELAFQSWNLLSLSNKRHNTMHNRKDNSITEIGRYWQKKKKREFEKFYSSPPTQT